MKNALPFALALVLAGSLAASSASAQVIIQGEVTVQPGQPAQPYYAQPQPQPAYGQQTYVASPYVQTGPAPAPVRYIHRSQSLAALWVPGIIALGVGWIGGALIATAGWEQCTSGCPTADWVGYQWIPVVGPWLSLAFSDGRDWTPLSYVTGAVQDIGLILFILGLVIRDEWDEPVYAFGDSPDAARLYLSGSPTMSGGNLSATLTF